MEDKYFVVIVILALNIINIILFFDNRRLRKKIVELEDILEKPKAVRDFLIFNRRVDQVTEKYLKAHEVQNKLDNLDEKYK